MQYYEMVATTLKGLEDVLAKEIENLGGEQVKLLKRAVSFHGDDSLLYKSNLALRTALRVLVPIDSFIAENENDLYLSIKDFPWENVLDLHQTFAVDATISGSFFNHSKFVALKTKDAIADRFRQKSGKRPNVDPINPDIPIRIHINNNQVEVSLDSSGLSLDRRGYRKNSSDAPINEVLAAGIILKSSWRSQMPLYDPMAGSGTFGIEAAMIGTHTPPNLRREFAFMNWYEFDSKLFEKCKADLEFKIRTQVNLQILSRDILSQNIELIAQNVINAGMEDYINVKRADFFETHPTHTNGVVVLNPPYGERLKLDSAVQFYKRIGDTLKQKYAGFDAWIISSDFEALKSIGLKAEHKEEMMNGGLDARLHGFKLFAGKK